jgi:hypothetical protein
MLAMLQDAVSRFQEHALTACKREQGLQRDAEEWILCRDRAYLFSFENVCDALGYDADFMRQGLLRWKETVLRGRRKRAQSPKSCMASRAGEMAFELSAAGRNG